MSKKNVFNVLRWEVNRDIIEHYDILPFFRRCYSDRKKKSKLKRIDHTSKYYKVPETVEDFKEFITLESNWMYNGRCEYEMIVHAWPAYKNDYKIDIHEQIMMNLDVIAELLYNEYKDKAKNKYKKEDEEPSSVTVADAAVIPGENIGNDSMQNELK